ncbi:protein DMR6-LIKE OXYGENASE 2 [Coffea arabica]|uniref:Protein DMR6-LIKE OXYGENASE 2 n=1 Tax=Coffea arabica TaxID=13443 RepID=A0A6P6XB27_COFAR|nr:flavonol synthase/flavanone 3-hydroxylase [Coffea arabica]
MKKALMSTPESLPDNTIIDFRAPPPSPVASGRRSSFNNEDALSEFLENSLKVPDLVLPDRVFPQQKSVQNPPKLDFRSLNSTENDSVTKFVDSVARIGCFEVVNHGVPEGLIKSVLAAGAGIFGISQEKRKLVTRSLEKPYGFEEFHGEEEKAVTEEFVWSQDESLKMDMEGIWPAGYSNFSERMQKLALAIENVAVTALEFLEQNTSTITRENVKQDPEFGPICYLHKHNGHIINGDQSVNSVLRYDVIRMLVRGSEFPHAICLHICDGAEEFHVYSKKGWASFCPDQGTIIITTGDQLQASGKGPYKHVMGRPIFRGADQERMSMVFPYPSVILKCDKHHKEQKISICWQFIATLILTLFFHFAVRLQSHARK